MTDTIHIMLDLETWGTTPGSDIRSIGACVFAPHTRHGGSLIHDGSLGTIRPFYRACDNPDMQVAGYDDGSGTGRRHRYNLRRDPRTVKWWSDQSAEAQAAFADPMDLRDALDAFGRWLYHDVVCTDAFEEHGLTGIKLWSHGPAFDPPILAAAYAAVGLSVPWNYRTPRDTRTAFDMAGIDDDGDGSYRTWLTQFNTGTYHHALDDAIAQAKAVCAAMRIVRRWRNTSNTDDGLVSHLLNITADIEDEGDRCYFGSTNQADHLKEIAQDLDANRFERDVE